MWSHSSLLFVLPSSYVLVVGHFLFPQESIGYGLKIKSSKLEDNNSCSLFRGGFELAWISSEAGAFSSRLELI